jgi:hypothetical protein
MDLGQIGRRREPYPHVPDVTTVAFGRDVRSDNRWEDATWPS